MHQVISRGKKNTAMMSFSGILTEQDIDAVIYFVREAFMSQKLKNTRYHTEENGWLNHEQYRLAFPFVLGDIALDEAWEGLTPEQREGKRLYLSACISCHDRSTVKDEGSIWKSYPISWPRNAYSHQRLMEHDAVSQASPYQVHDVKMAYLPKTQQEKQGQKIFHANCAFCHAHDGSGKNWIGQFIEPSARNFTVQSIQKLFTKKQLKERIKNGVNGTAMPAWRYVLSEAELESVVSFMWYRFE